jgi:tight adherence protein C
MSQALVPILTFISVMAIGAAFVIGRAARKQLVRNRLDEFGPIHVPGEADGGQAGSRWQLFESIGTRFAPKDATGDMQKSLAQAGFTAPSAASIYLGARMMLLVVGLIIAVALVMPMQLMMALKFVIVFGMGWTMSLFPSLYVDIRRGRRATEIRHHLPDAVDMLEICVSSGMGLDMAWNAVAEEIRRVSSILADEMALTNLEINLGAGRAEAMRHMAERTGSDDLNSLVSTLVQSEKFGTAVSDALRTFASSMREIRQTRAAESAEKMGVKMLFPMIAFILPSILIVMGGGAVIKIMEMFGRL